MKHQVRYSSIDSTAKSLALLFVVLLTLLASCTVRRSLQAQLQVPVTKSLHVTKAALGTNTLCHISPESTLKGKTGSLSKLDLGFPALPTASLRFTSHITGSCQRLLFADWHRAHTVPLYILYQKMKVLS